MFPPFPWENRPTDPTGHGSRLGRRSAVSGSVSTRPGRLADLRASTTSSTLEKDVVRVLRRRRMGCEILLQQKVENFFELDILIGGGGYW